MPFMVSEPYTRTFSSQSGFSMRIAGSKDTTYLYMGDTVGFRVTPVPSYRSPSGI